MKRYFDKKPNPAKIPNKNQSDISLFFNPLQKNKTVRDQKGIKQTFTLNSGVVKL